MATTYYAPRETGPWRNKAIGHCPPSETQYSTISVLRMRNNLDEVMVNLDKQPSSSYLPGNLGMEFFVNIITFIADGHEATEDTI